MFFRSLLSLICVALMGISKDELETLIQAKLGPVEASMQFLSEKYDVLLDKLTELESANKALIEENAALKMQLNTAFSASKLEDNALKSQLNTLGNTVKNHTGVLDELEQYSRRECLEFKGIPYEDDECTNEIICQVAELVNIHIDDNDISVSHRLPKGKPWTDQEGVLHQPDSPIIIAKFVRRDIANELYRARFRLKGKSTNDIECIQSRPQGNNIYISENLTPLKQKLFKSCLKVKKELKYKFISTSNGRIYLKKDKGIPSVLISNLSDLAKLKNSVGHNNNIHGESTQSEPV